MIQFDGNDNRSCAGCRMACINNVKSCALGLQTHQSLPGNAPAAGCSKHSSIWLHQMPHAESALRPEPDMQQITCSAPTTHQMQQQQVAYCGRMMQWQLNTQFALNAVQAAGDDSYIES
jgi:hypothetical protein